MKKSTKNLIWLSVLIVLSVISVYFITSCSKGFSMRGFIGLLKNASVYWLIGACVCSFGFIYFEGLGLKLTCHLFGYDFSDGKATLFAATDIYFSAVTPSATGGQPAALLMMISHGVPTAVSTIALLLNLMMYTVSIVLLSIICYIAYPALLYSLDTAALIIIAVSASLQVIFIVIFILCIFNEKLVLTVSRFAMKLLAKLRIIKNFDLHYEKLLNMVKQYKECGIILRREVWLMFKVFLCNLMQRLSVVMVAVCVFVGVGGAPSRAFEAFSAQVFAILGANAAPIPGAVGVVDYIFLNGFQNLIGDPVSVELLSRGISFYFNLLFCGVLILLNFFYFKSKNRNDS